MGGQDGRSWQYANGQAGRYRGLNSGQAGTFETNSPSYSCFFESIYRSCPVDASSRKDCQWQHVVRRDSLPVCHPDDGLWPRRHTRPRSGFPFYQGELKLISSKLRMQINTHAACYFKSNGRVYTGESGKNLRNPVDPKIFWYSNSNLNQIPVGRKSIFCFLGKFNKTTRVGRQYFTLFRDDNIVTTSIADEQRVSK